MNLSASRASARQRDMANEGSDFKQALLTGLSGKAKNIPSKYFYDAEGSRLFEEICALPEYYLTRIELGLLERHAKEIAALIGSNAEIVEFGAGAGEKIRPLFNNGRPHSSPIDISDYRLRDTAH
jgi:uncharacterized SAM-dependent methyltransferase